MLSSLLKNRILFRGSNFGNQSGIPQTIPRQDTGNFQFDSRLNTVVKFFHLRLKKENKIKSSPA